MEVTDRTVYPVERGERRCRICHKVHDCYPTRQTGRSWAARDDGHDYEPESWYEVAMRYGYSQGRERKTFGVI